MLSFLSHFLHSAFRLIVNLGPGLSLIRDDPTLSHLGPFVLPIFREVGNLPMKILEICKSFPKIEDDRRKSG